MHRKERFNCRIVTDVVGSKFCEVYFLFEMLCGFFSSRLLRLYLFYVHQISNDYVSHPVCKQFDVLRANVGVDWHVNYMV